MQKTTSIFRLVCPLLTAVAGITVLASSSPASAQYVIGRSANTYVNLPTPTVLTTSGDENEYNLTLPFPVMFLGTTQTAVSIGDNGGLIFGTGQNVSLGNPTPGSTAAPNGWIGGAWDDLHWAVAGSQLSYQVFGTAPNRNIVIEWRDVSHWFQGVTSNFQIRLFESEDKVEVDYGTTGGSGTGYSATMALEDPTGTVFFLFAPSGCTNNCANADLNALANMRVTVGSPNTPEFTGSFGTFTTGVLPGNSGTGDVIITNFSAAPATNVSVDVYLSTDATFDAGDLKVGSATAAAVAGSGDTTLPMTVDIPAGTAPDVYTLFAFVDSGDDYPEVAENDNIVEGPQFSTAFEVSPEDLTTAQAGVNPGEIITFDVVINNTGVPYTGPLTIELYASSDQLFDGNDDFIVSATGNLTGVGQETIQVSGTLPPLQPGGYYPIAIIDTAGMITEINENNNIVVSDTQFQTGPDFGISAITIPATVAPGTAVPVSLTVDSLSVAYSGDVIYRLYASTDMEIDGSDTVLGDFSVIFAGEASQMASENVTFPMAMPPGAYYVLAEADSIGVITEVSEVNNVGVSPTQILNANDFSIENVSATPNTVEVGDTVALTGTINSTGLTYTGNVPFGVFISPDDIFDPGDTLIHSDVTFVPGLATAALDVSFEVPTVFPGTYTLFVVADPNLTIPEADETNNFADGGSFAVQGADLRVATGGFTGDPIAFIGRPYRVELTIENTGIADANDFQFAFYLSEDQSIRIFDDQIFLSQAVSLEAGNTATYIADVTMPTFTSTQTLFFGVIIDIFDAAPETNTNNNIGRIPGALSIVFPIPDLAVQIVETATSAAAGETMAITRLLTNTGVADAPTFDYTYYLSSNPVITTDDVELATFRSSLVTGADDYAIDIVTVPSNVLAGNYYIGLAVDPANLVEEISDENNTAVGNLIPVFGAAIRFITDSLPDATAGVPYDFGVYAEGGAQALTISVSDGDLPTGLTLANGIISGTPTVEGLSTFTLRASAGTAFADKEFSIRVSSPTVRLQIATPILPTGVVGREYDGSLTSVGGTGPFVWTSISELPLGLTLSEDGRLTGTPEVPGSRQITFSVRDAVNNSDSKNLSLNIINPSQTVEITQAPLPDAVIGMPYCSPEAVRFLAENGVAPYTWALVGDAPPGMSVSEEGEICGTPEMVGEFPLIVRAQDQTGLFDTALFTFRVLTGNDLTITVFTLPDATVEEAYTTVLTAVRGSEPYVWSLIDGEGSLPPGMTLADNGTLSGTPSADGTYAFIANVTDAQGRVDTQALSINVNAKPDTTGDDGGCTCAAPRSDSGRSGALLVLGLGLLGLAHRRRRR